MIRFIQTATGVEIQITGNSAAQEARALAQFLTSIPRGRREIVIGGVPQCMNGAFMIMGVRKLVQMGWLNP